MRVRGSSPAAGCPPTNPTAGSSHLRYSRTSTTPAGSPKRKSSGRSSRITPYDTDDDAVEIANDPPFGLGGTVWSSDTDRATCLPRQVHTGTIGVNHYALDIGAPFGGTKASGLGRELGPEGLAAYYTLKSIYRTERTDHE